MNLISINTRKNETLRNHQNWVNMHTSKIENFSWKLTRWHVCILPKIFWDFKQFEMTPVLISWFQRTIRNHQNPQEITNIHQESQTSSRNHQTSIRNHGVRHRWWKQESHDILKISIFPNKHVSLSPNPESTSNIPPIRQQPCFHAALRAGAQHTCKTPSEQFNHAGVLSPDCIE